MLLVRTDPRMELSRYSQFALLLLFQLLFVHSEAASSQLLALLRSNNAVITIERDPNTKCQKDLVECVDCSHGIICRPEENNGLVQIAKVECLAQSSTPYCNPDTALCSSLPPDGCGTNQFLCPPKDGAYPDPSNCSRYHLCANGVSTTNNCPRNNVYDHATGQCKLRRRVTDCVTINCVNREGQVVVYPADDRIWGRCVNGKALLLGRCKDYERYDVAQQKCVRVCRSTGNQPTDPFECQKYVYCAEIAPNRYEGVEQSCACNEGFDPDKNRCTADAKCLDDLDSLCGSNANAKPATESSKGTEPAKPTESSKPETFIINNSGSANAGNVVSNGNDNVDGNLVNGNGNGANNNSGNVSKRQRRLALSPLIINNSGSGNKDNEVSNGNDDVNGNLVNGNGNGDNQNSGNVKGLLKYLISTFIINNSGSGNGGNTVSNGNDDVDGNLVNGNSNGDNTNSGNVHQGPNGPEVSPLIVSNSGNVGSNNGIINGNDDVDGNLVSGNNNGDNTDSGNVAKGKDEPSVSPLIINNSGSANSNNHVVNGDDNVDGNLVNGNNNGDNTNSGNVKKDTDGPAVSPFIINNSGNANSNNEVVNGDDDVDGNLVNGNGNGDNVNSGNVHSSQKRPVISTLVINNSGHLNNGNTVSNGDDDVDGNVVNGNGNGENVNSGNVNSVNDESSTARTKRSTPLEVDEENSEEENASNEEVDVHQSDKSALENFFKLVIQWIVDIIVN